MSTQWIDPIYDRSQSDIIENPPKSKAFLNAKDFNRIEGNIEYLTEKLSAYLPHIRWSKTDWNTSNIPTTADIKRIRLAISEIKDAIQGLYNNYIFSGYKNIPDLENKYLDFNHVNLLEGNLNTLNLFYEIMAEGFIKSGVFKCENNRKLFLPIKRRT